MSRARCVSLLLTLALSIGSSPALAQVDPQAFGQYSAKANFVSLVGGVEQVDLSSQATATEPFVRLYMQTVPTESKDSLHKQFLAWASIRLLGAPNQNDTNGIFSVFQDPSGQITASKLSSVGTAMDFTLGMAYRLFGFDKTDGDDCELDAPASQQCYEDDSNLIDLIVGFGGTTPLQSNTVTAAFTSPAFGTTECNALFQKIGALHLPSNIYGIQQTSNGMATGSSTACLVNTNAPTTSNGTTTYAPINTIAYSNADRKSFLYKDLVGIRYSHPKLIGANKFILGSVDATVGMDSAITGGVFRGNRWIFKTDGTYPLVGVGKTTFYLFGSFSVRFARNDTNNTPLILQAASVSNLTGSGSTAVPNINTVVLPLAQPDRDFYRIGVGIDLASLFK